MYLLSTYVPTTVIDLDLFYSCSWQEVNFNCVKIDLTVPNGGQHAVDDMHCSNIPRSSSSEPCKGPCDATHWQYSPWSQCSRTCGGGIKTRTANCVDGRNNTIDDSHCHAKDKYVRHTCNHERCPMWTYEDWTAVSVPSLRCTFYCLTYLFDDFSVRPRAARDTERRNIIAPSADRSSTRTCVTRKN